MKTSESIDQLAVALSKAQATFPNAQMNAVNPFLKNRYADLGSITDAVRDVLAQHGLSYVQFPAVPPVEFFPAVALTTRVMHESGQWLEDTFVMPLPAEERGKSLMQVAGSAITYARRYALASVFGIVADEDADGNVPQQQPQRQAKPTPAQSNGDKPAMPTKPTPEQMKAFHAAGNAYFGDKWDEERSKVVNWATGGRSSSSKHLTRDECSKAIDAINRKAEAA